MGKPQNWFFVRNKIRIICKNKMGSSDIQSWNAMICKKKKRAKFITK